MQSEQICTVPSSIMRYLTARHRSSTGLNFPCPRNFPARFFAGSSPSPMPAHECRVVPPILTAAIPVDAVIANECELFPPKVEEDALSALDLVQHCCLLWGQLHIRRLGFQWGKVSTKINTFTLVRCRR
ncbi:hypothetical protein BDN71DRAFT_444235 [Pleurotus eryngii]|uniref:Uncharacterized protein n=1 Tax=Pleurotus eryngii TaxID=5323 RepID=A0A9P6DB39_PLEER|nr:hypothetical protein BDN71DRAFT_444235 [Pleurotus eryngii]